MSEGQPRDRPVGVFLDFAPADEAAARELDAFLRGHAIRTAVDRERFLQDGLPDEQVLQDLGACDLLVVIWSAAAAADERLAAHRELAESFGKRWLAYAVDDAPVVPGATAVLHADDAAARSDLLRAVTPGSHPPVRPPVGVTVRPGVWTIERDAPPGLVLELRLTDDGRLAGTQKQAGLVGEVGGTWRFAPADAQLILDTEVRFGLRPVRTEVELQLLAAAAEGRLSAEDVHGLAAPARYTISPGHLP